MSGDVQPRKRKDKKRRKDEGEQILAQTAHNPPATNSSSDDVNIHVHKEGGTGGGICAKLVFFVLLSALVVVIGMIITQYRGLSDVDTVDSESKFAQIFEGWIDTGHRHDDHDVDEPIDEHDHEEDEEDASEDEDEGHDASEGDEDETEEKELSDENEDEDDEDEDEDEEPIVNHSDEDQTVEESDENSLDDEDDDNELSEEKIIYGRDESEEKEEEDEADEDEESEEDEQDHDEDEQELQNIASDEEENDEDDGSPEKASKEDEDDDDDDEKDDTDDSDEKTPTKPEKVVEKRDVDEESPPEEEKQQESAGMAVKLGVGVALLVVAHLVLVRKWRSSAPVDKPTNEEAKEQPTPDLSRRNTIVAPPTLQEVEPDIEQDEEDYSEEELSEEETHPEPKSAKTRYQELRSTYTRSLTPEGEIDYHKEPETYDEEYDDEEEEVSEEEEEDEEEEEGESENEDYDDDEDEELLKRLEAKYGKLHGNKSAGPATKEADESDSDRQSNDEEDYEHSDITNKEDYNIKEKLDEAQKSAQNNSAYAIKLFDTILQNYPNSPRGLYGKALSLDYLADQKRSNEILDQALQLYVKLFNLPDVPDALFKVAAERCIERMRFVGQYRNAINVHWKLIKRFPNNPEYSNNLAITYLTINRVEEARSVLKDVLLKWPEDGVALVHFGFILKTTDNNLLDAIDYLKKGLDTKDKGVIDGRFYFHLGDALGRLGRTDEAMKIYEEGVKNKVFLSKYQRSLYNVPRLTGKPWWNIEDLPYLDLFRLLSQNWKEIRDEGLAVLNSKALFQDESENLKDTGDWKQFELFARGQKNVNNCNRCPFTCSVIEKIPEARGCKRGQTKFSVMHPGTHVWPHCGPTNCRLRVHLGLKVPPKTFIRVANDIRSWKEGRVFVFDDSFEHEVWHNGSDFRLVLIIDVWHPELTSAEKRNLSPI